MLNLKRWIIEIVILSLVFAGVGYAAHEQYFPLGVKSDGDVIVGKTLKTFQGSDVASTNDMTLGDGNFFDITGTTTINTIATKGIGTFVVLEFDGILQLTHSGDLFLPTAANITTAAGDIAVFYEYAAVDWRCASYTRADGTALAASAVAWDDIGNPDANKSIDFTDYYTDFDFGDTDHDMFTIWATGAFGDYSVVKIEQKTGDPTDGDLLHLKTADAEANVDNLIMSNGDDDYVTHKIVEAGTYTIDITSDGTALLAIVDPTTISAVFTVSPDGTNEVFQVNDGSVDFTDGAGGTTGTLTIASDGDLTYNKNIYADNAAGPAFLNEAATNTNPTLIPDKAEEDTGWGWASDTLHAVLGGVDEYSFSTSTFDVNSNTITEAGNITTTDAAGPSIVNEAATTTNPTLIPNRAEDDTGIGWASDTIHIVLGGADEYSFSTTVFLVNDNIIQRPVIKDYGETVNAIGNVDTNTHDIDLESGNVVTCTLTGNPTFTFSNPPASGTCGSFTLIVTQDASPVIVWPGAVDWAGGTAPTLTTSGIDTFTFFTLDAGTIWYGYAAGLEMKSP